MSRKKRFLILFSTLFIVFLSALLLRQGLKSADTRFTEYTTALFRQEVSSNAITLHYTLKDPSSYQISDTPVNLGRVSIDTAAMGAAAENELARLHTFEAFSLSSENRLIYDLLEDSFTSSAQMAPYALYEEPLSPLTGTQAQLPILLSEYQFYSQEDVETYLKLLKEMPEYFQAIIDFEQAKADAGLFMTSERADSVMDECDAFVNMGNQHYLHETFKTRISDLNLSHQDYDSYIEQNASAISQYVYPAYEALKTCLYELKDTGQNENGLCYLPEGKEYYQLLVKEVTGSDRTLMELQTLTLSQIKSDLAAMEKAMGTLESSAQSDATDVGSEGSAGVDAADVFEDSNPTSLLTTLKEKIAGNFPAPADVNFSIKYVEESMEDYLSPAFYLIPAIDNSDENVIYINPLHMTDDLTLFTTLAHEGYPGHMYQTTYFANTNPAPIRQILGCGGYTEGWATYCEMMSYYFAPIPKAEATVMQKNSSIMLGLYALADMGIHYEGWTLTDTIRFFSDYGISDTDAIGEIYQLILGDPANYLKYYIGYVEFLELKKDAMAKWGDDFSQERFHREVLEIGPAPFAVLRDRML